MIEDRLMSGKRILGVIVAAGVLPVLLVGMVAAPALGAAPVWQVSSESLPTNLPHSGRGEYQIEVANVGDASSSGPVTVVDTLPAGVTATAAGEVFKAQTSGLTNSYWVCSGTGTSVVTCTNAPNPAIVPSPVGGQLTLEEVSEGLESPGLLGHLAPVLGIEVNVTSGTSNGEPNTVRVSGGGGDPVVDSEPQAIGDSAPSFGLSRFAVAILNRDGSPDTQAGSHPYEMTTSFTLNNVFPRAIETFPGVEPVGSGPRDIEVELPVGLVGDPTATPKCPRGVFDEREESLIHGGAPCPANTQVGTVALTTGGFSRLTILIPVYDLVPPAGVPAQFAFGLNTKVGYIDAGVRTGAGYGLKADLRNILEVQVVEAVLSLWGVPGDSSHDIERGVEEVRETPFGGAAIKPLLTLPSACGTPLKTEIYADSWQERGLFSEAPGPFNIDGTPDLSDPRWTHPDPSVSPAATTGCAKLDFSPTLTVTPTTKTTDTPTGLDVDLKIPQSNDTPESLAAADLKNTTVTLPQGVTISPSQANGLSACTPQEIGLDNAAKPSCPETSKVGTVEATTPILEGALTGSVYVAQQGNAGPAQGANPFNSLFAIYLVLEEPKLGVLVKLAGKVSADPTTGQLTTTFTETPQQPIGEFKLHFFGGPRAALVTPRTCGSYTTTSMLEGWNGALVTQSVPGSDFAIEAGCTQGFAPSFVAGSTSNEAGAFSPFTVSLGRNDGEQELGQVSVRMPPGLLGMVSKVTPCGEPQAEAGTCPEASRIGHVTIAAGPGPTPLVLPQVGRQEDPVYLTGPYHGSPYGLSIVTHAEAGPFNLGTVVVRSAISVDPHTAQLTITSAPLPTILAGVPLGIRRVNVIVDRPGFTFNPTDCEPLAVTGTIASAQGVGAGVSSRFQAANCAVLAFRPSFKVYSQGKASKAGGASLDVKVTSGAGQANIGRVVVSLPKQLPARLTTLQKACTEAVFAANPAGCPAASDVGTAKAVTPVLNFPLSGPAYLVSHGGAAFPDLVVVLQGQGIRLDLVGNTSIKGSITTSTFATVPDAPISSFEVKLPQGPHSALAANLPAKAGFDLCGSKLTMPTTITAQNGARIVQSTRIALTGCPRKAKLRRTKLRKK